MKFTLLTLLFTQILFCQNPFFEHQKHFTRQDTLRGSITPERAWWNVTHYDLNVAVYPNEKKIKGHNIITFETLKPHSRMQIDLQEPMKITAVRFENKELAFTREGNVFWIDFEEKLPINQSNQIRIDFEGNPRIAKNAPWDGGIVWAKDRNGMDFIATANQSIGASVWWPNKDHDYDEPEKGVLINVTTPEHPTDVSNGNLVNITHNKKAKTKTYTWEVKNTINNYGINLNIGNYVHFSEIYKGLNGELDCNYWVLKHNLEKAKKQFKQAKMTLEAFEYWFGPYPFYEDSYKLVEVPYLGMEHQSSVTYGNKYKNGYMGMDRSYTGVGLLFDYIIVHESGHEWFANSITNADVADLWIHESFTTYSESLFIDYHFGTEKANQYIIGMRANIRNDRPLIGIYDLNYSGSSDMYDKGANMLHTLRQIVNNDHKWRKILLGLNKKFYHKLVTANDIINYINKQTKPDLTSFFDQYVKTVDIPRLILTKNKKGFTYKFENVIKEFKMPVRVFIDGKAKWLKVTTKEKQFKSCRKSDKITVDPNFYINSTIK